MRKAKSECPGFTRTGRLALSHGLWAAGLSPLCLFGLGEGGTKGSGNAEHFCRGPVYRDGISCRWLFASEISRI